MSTIKSEAVKEKVEVSDIHKDETESSVNFDATGAFVLVSILPVILFMVLTRPMRFYRGRPEFIDIFGTDISYQFIMDNHFRIMIGLFLLGLVATALLLFLAKFAAKVVKKISDALDANFYGWLGKEALEAHKSGSSIPFLILLPIACAITYAVIYLASAVYFMGVFVAMIIGA